MKPVTKVSAEAQSTTILRQHILSGRVKPGARLTEVSLAEQLGVARATVRTSLHKLASEGIVTQTPYTGWRVAALAPKDVWELWTLRASLEGLAAKLAANSMNSDYRARINGAMEDLVKACQKGDAAKASAADFALHGTIIRLVGHQRLEDQYRQVEQQVKIYISSSNALVGDRLIEIIAQHEPLVEALLAGDGDRAARESWLHHQSEGEKLAAWIANQDQAA